MPNEQLSSEDPVIINLAVARQIPGLESVDAAKYLRVVDDWAEAIRDGTKREEAFAAGDPLYQHDPDLWRAGGMAVSIAGRSIGVSYTEDHLDPADPSQTFIHGVIDKKRGTCANMPILYLGIAHRLGWPLRGVVGPDHFWVRWDDPKTGKTFNLESTSNTSDGSMGSFSSPPDSEYIKQLGITETALACGSDCRSLTNRELLGVFLQNRAGYWAAVGRWDKAEHDLLLARQCFPTNREIFTFLVEAMHHRAVGASGLPLFTEAELAELAETLAHGVSVSP